MVGCFRAHVPDAPKGGGGNDNPGDFLASWGYFFAAIGGLGIALAVGATYFLGSKIGRGVAITAAGILGTGLAFIYVGPWLAWIVGGTVVCVVGAGAFIIWRNRNRIVARIEEVTGLEVDGK